MQEICQSGSEGGQSSPLSLPLSLSEASPGPHVLCGEADSDHHVQCTAHAVARESFLVLIRAF
jgi:hypothetical protein